MEQSAYPASPRHVAAGESPVRPRAPGLFPGSDQWPTLDELRARIAAGELRFVILAGLRGAGPGGQASGTGPASSGLAGWVTASCSAVSIDTTTVGLYDRAGVS